MGCGSSATIGQAYKSDYLQYLDSAAEAEADVFFVEPSPFTLGFRDHVRCAFELPMIFCLLIDDDDDLKHRAWVYPCGTRRDLWQHERQVWGGGSFAFMKGKVEQPRPP